MRKRASKPYASKKLTKSLFILLALFLLSGCWDMRDIDQRAMIISIGIDEYQPSQEDLNKQDNQFLETTPEYLMTVEIPIYRALAQNGSGGDSDGKPAIVLSSTGSTPAHISALYRSRIWRAPFYGHTQVLVIGEDVAKTSVRDVIDFIDRHPEVSRRLKLIIAHGEAKPVIEVEPGGEPLLGIYLKNLLEKTNNSGGVLQRTMGEAVRDLSTTGNTLLPRVRAAEKEVVVGGSAVIKDWKLIGWLSEPETFGAKLLMGMVDSGNVIAGQPQTSVGEISLLIENSATSVRVASADGKPKIQVSIEIEGDLNERFGGREKLSLPMLEKITTMLEAEVTKMVEKALDKLQHEFRVDVLGFGDQINKQQHKLWRQLESNWNEQHFPNTDVSITCSVKVRRTGVVF